MTRTTKRLEFKGDTVETQRIRVTTEHLSEFTGDFVQVFHSWGDNSTTAMLFTNEEARYVAEVLSKIIASWRKK